MIDPKYPPKALITGFGFSNAAARHANVSFSRSYGNTSGYVNGDNVKPWDLSNDVYAFGVTCCQVCSYSAAVECFSEYGTLFRLPW